LPEEDLVYGSGWTDMWFLRGRYRTVNAKVIGTPRMDHSWLIRGDLRVFHQAIPLETDRVDPRVLLISYL
jgi:hypothetical protein